MNNDLGEGGVVDAGAYGGGRRRALVSVGRGVCERILAQQHGEFHLVARHLARTSSVAAGASRRFGILVFEMLRDLDVCAAWYGAMLVHSGLIYLSRTVVKSSCVYVM